MPIYFRTAFNLEVGIVDLAPKVETPSLAIDPGAVGTVLVCQVSLKP